MAVNVRIPAPLRPLVGNQSSVECQPGTVRELIDHVIVTKSVQPRIVEVKVVDDVPFARVASDHYPVMLKLKLD